MILPRISSRSAKDPYGGKFSFVFREVHIGTEKLSHVLSRDLRLTTFTSSLGTVRNSVQCICQVYEVTL